jgi:hypothetical protein
LVCLRNWAYRAAHPEPPFLDGRPNPHVVKLIDTLRAAMRVHLIDQPDRDARPAPASPAFCVPLALSAPSTAIIAAVGTQNASGAENAGRTSALTTIAPCRRSLSSFDHTCAMRRTSSLQRLSVDIAAIGLIMLVTITGCSDVQTIRIGLRRETEAGPPIAVFTRDEGPDAIEVLDAKSGAPVWSAVRSNGGVQPPEIVLGVVPSGWELRTGPLPFPTVVRVRARRDTVEGVPHRYISLSANIASIPVGSVFDGRNAVAAACFRINTCPRGSVMLGRTDVAQVGVALMIAVALLVALLRALGLWKRRLDGSNV